MLRGMMGRASFRQHACAAFAPASATAGVHAAASAAQQTTTAATWCARRFNATNSNGAGEQANSNGKAGESASASSSAAGGGAGDAKADAKAGANAQQQEGAGEPKKAGGIRGHIDGIRTDIHQFPDIYNGPNMLSFVLFTIFCLSSTGTQVEQNWWLANWAVDGDSHRHPWSILLHSVHTNNFLSMAFAILLLHNSLHPLIHGLAGGSPALLQYMALVSVCSGLAMWLGQSLWYGEGTKDVLGRAYRGEKQYGPWDIAAAIMVMQYLRLGIPPHRLLLSFNGWVKYACCVGAVVICYYDPQPVVCGAVLGFGLCKFAPAFRGVAAAV